MLKNRKYDLVIVGAGVLGTFCAYHALKKGKSVLLTALNKKGVELLVEGLYKEEPKKGSGGGIVIEEPLQETKNSQI